MNKYEKYIEREKRREGETRQQIEEDERERRSA